MRRALWILPALLVFRPLSLRAGDQVSPIVDLSVNGMTLSSHGTVWYYCGNLLLDCTCSVSHSIRESPSGALLWGFTNKVTVSAGLSGNAYDGTMSTTGNSGTCYYAVAAGTGSEGADQYVSSGTQCITAPPPPPPAITVCDPGHPPCAGNGTSDEPLILDLNGDGIHTTAIELAPVLFDMNADGRRDVTAWTDPQTEEGFLYIDRNHNHAVDGNPELFGNRTPLPDGTIAANGFEALAAWDKAENGGNDDGVIAPYDEVWGNLRVWVDRNHDGIATSSETYALGELGIASIRLTFERFGPDRMFGLDASGNFHVLQGSFQQRLRGKPGLVDRPMHDVFFRVRYQ